MPVVLVGRAIEDIAFAEFELLAIAQLGPAHPIGHDQGLAQRMAMPGRPGARCECDDGTRQARGVVAGELTTDRGAAGEVFLRTRDLVLFVPAADLHGGVSLRWDLRRTQRVKHGEEGEGCEHTGPIRAA